MGVPPENASLGVSFGARRPPEGPRRRAALRNTRRFTNHLRGRTLLLKLRTSAQSVLKSFAAEEAARPNVTVDSVRHVAQRIALDDDGAQARDTEIPSRKV